MEDSLLRSRTAHRNAANETSSVIDLFFAVSQNPFPESGALRQQVKRPRRNDNSYDNEQHFIIEEMRVITQ
jgi:hypothetical protein